MRGDDPKALGEDSGENHLERPIFHGGLQHPSVQPGGIGKDRGIPSLESRLRLGFGDAVPGDVARFSSSQ